MNLQVVVGFIFNKEKQILIAKRPDHAHLGGFWEFPGGKVEVQESSKQAIARELHEEIGIKVLQSTYITTYSHSYPKNTIDFDLWHINAFSCQAYGKEGQQVRWVNVDDLHQFTFPAANQNMLHCVHSLAV